MNEGIHRSVQTLGAIERRYSPATLAHWSRYEVYMFRMLVRDEDIFISVENVWWKVSAWHVLAIRDGNEEWRFLEIDSLEKVEAPHNAVYSYSIAMCWNPKRDGPFCADHKESIEWLARGEIQTI